VRGVPMRSESLSVPTERGRCASLPVSSSQAQINTDGGVVGEDHLGLGRREVDDRIIVGELPLNDEPRIWWERHLLHTPISTQERHVPRGRSSAFAAIKEIFHPLPLVIALEQERLGGHIERRRGRAVETQRQLGELEGPP
jgi:hypothetical protein